jgi:hypothetical protein
MALVRLPLSTDSAAVLRYPRIPQPFCALKARRNYFVAQ